MIKLIATDIDGTLLEEGTLDLALKRYLHRFWMI